jgi:hypothetical protein
MEEDTIQLAPRVAKDGTPTSPQLLCLDLERDKVVLSAAPTEADLRVMASFKPPFQRDMGGLMSVE